MTTSDILILLQLIVAALGLSFVGIQIFLLSRQNRKDTQWKRIDASFKVIKEYWDVIDGSNAELRKKLLELNHNPEISIDKMREWMLDDIFRQDMYYTIKYFESLALGVFRQYYDEEIIKEHLDTVVQSNYELLKFYLQFRRMETHTANIGIYFERLAKKWQRGLNNDN